MSILILQPIFKKRIWGNNYFKNTLNYKLDDDKYGELWSLSAHPEGLTFVINSPYKRKSLSELFVEHPKMFNTEYKEFPLMIKLLSTSDVLSVQVHPDDNYARKVENQFGKTECWYFLETETDAKIIYGHNAKNRDDMEYAIVKGECESLLNYKGVEPYDFVMIPSRTVHSPGKGLLFLEVQQSSNLTYRLYDYNRVDSDGKTRELHVKKGLDVIDFPQKELPHIKNYKNAENIETLTDCEFFGVELAKVDGELNYNFQKNIFHIFTVASGKVSVFDGEQTYEIKLGESFITTADEKKIRIKGNGQVLISYPQK